MYQYEAQCLAFSIPFSHSPSRAHALSRSRARARAPPLSFARSLSLFLSLTLSLSFFLSLQVHPVTWDLEHPHYLVDYSLWIPCTICPSLSLPLFLALFLPLALSCFSPWTCMFQHLPPASHTADFDHPCTRSHVTLRFRMLLCVAVYCYVLLIYKHNGKTCTRNGSSANGVERLHYYTTYGCSATGVER